MAALERARCALSESFRFAAALIKDARKLLALTLLNAVPIVDLIVAGYMVGVARHNPREPPEVREFRRLFKEGFMLLLARALLGVSLAIPVWAIAIALVPLRVNVPELLGKVFKQPVGTAAVVLVFNLIFAPAIGLYAKRGEVREILELREAWRAVREFGLADYVFACLVPTALFYPLVALSSILSFPPPPAQRHASGLTEVLLMLIVRWIWQDIPPRLASAPLKVLADTVYYKVLAQLPYPAAAPPPPSPPPLTVDEMYERLVDLALRAWGGSPERAKERVENWIREVMEKRGVCREEAIMLLYEEL